jgi:hypothetical protein
MWSSWIGTTDSPEEARTFIVTAKLTYPLENNDEFEVYDKATGRYVSMEEACSTSTSVS